MFLYTNQTQPDARKGRLPEPFVVQDLVSNWVDVRFWGSESRGESKRTSSWQVWPSFWLTVTVDVVCWFCVVDSLRIHVSPRREKEAVHLVRRAQGVRHGGRERSLEGDIRDLRDAELDIGAEPNGDRRLLCAWSVCSSVFKPAIDALVVVVDRV